MPLLAGRTEAAPEDAVLSIENVWIDRSFEAGRADAEHAGKLGAKVIDASTRDAQTLLPQLDLEWRANPVALTGVTAHGPMFTLEMLGRRHGMRLAYSAKMIRWDDGTAGVNVEGLGNLAAATPEPGMSDATWAIKMANYTLSTPLEQYSGGGKMSQRQFGEQVAGSYDDPLYVWVIAPVKGAARYIAPTLTS
jgi:hypothetical protein